GGVKIRCQLDDGRAVEGDAVDEVENTANEDLVPGIEVDASLVALICHRIIHHGLNPSDASNARTSSTWYLLASLLGWGRCRYRRLPFRSKATREPACSRTSPPSPMINASRSAKTIAAAVGFLNTA